MSQRVGGDAIERTFQEMWRDMNNVIDANNQANEQVRERYFKWFVLIVAGFAMQLISSLLQMFNDDSIP